MFVNQSDWKVIPMSALIAGIIAFVMGRSYMKTMDLITYAADMMSLFISAISHSPTTAMTIMPFVLVFQLIFSGGIISIPTVAEPVTNLTVSSPGFKALAAQADVNGKRNATVSRMLKKMGDTEIVVEVSLGQILDLLKEQDATVNTDSAEPVKVSQIAGNLLNDPIMEQYAGEKFPIRTTLGDLMAMVGEQEARKQIDEESRKANYKPVYECSPANIARNWLHLMLFIFIFSALSIIVLEFIDKDKR